MRLVLQCAVCGTIHTVGTKRCLACRASGLHNLRLLFECLNCFRVGLGPSCQVCTQLLSLDPEMNAGETPDPPNPLPGREGDWGGVVAERVPEERGHAYEEEAAGMEVEALREELPLAELDESEPKRADKADSSLDGE